MTPRAARKIKGAAHKANDLGLGLVTFMTFTCNLEARVRLELGDIVLGKEMRRTLNAMQQRFRREEYRDFAYIWVAENPGNKNPHIHLLTNHSVPRREFERFAAWVESLWGWGWVKIERIRQPESAGRYILKAVGYALKGEEARQGIVRGNRYGLSRNIRPEERVIEYEDEEATLALMGAVRLIPPGEDGIELAEGVYLTRYGLAFTAGTSLVDIENVVADLAQGAIPG